jgi:catechol 2,3-dioxygenase-like lactoylglutathione lyase family enzyme
MLGNRDAHPDLAVRNIAAARKFYGDTLGLKEVANEGDEFVVYESGNTTFHVYRSDFAGTNKATAMSWSVGDELDDVVRNLRKRGVEFEHYEMPGMTLEGDVHRSGDMKVAWFKDPDGNILSLANQ